MLNKEAESNNKLDRNVHKFQKGIKYIEELRKSNSDLKKKLENTSQNDVNIFVIDNAPMIEPTKSLVDNDSESELEKNYHWNKKN